MFGQVIPESVESCASRVIIPQNVVRISDPVSCWCLISVKETPGWHGLDYEVPFNAVFGFDTVLDEHCMAHNIVVHVIEYPEVAHSVDGSASVVRLVYGVFLDVREMHVAHQVVMDGVAAHLAHLANIVQLYIFNSTN